MYIATVSRKELKNLYKNERYTIAPNDNKKTEVDLEPIVKLFSKIYIQSIKSS